MLLLHFFAVQNPLKYYQWLATKRSTHVLARLFKSGLGLLTVVIVFFPRLIPASPMARISRSTVHLATFVPSRRS
jgi:hypothetical protein